MANWLKFLLIHSLSFTAFILAAKVGFYIKLTSHGVCPIWLATGAALGLCLNFGYELIPTFIFASFIFHFSVGLSFNYSLLVALSDGVSFLIGVFLIRKFVSKTFKYYESPVQFIKFLLFGPLITPICSSTISAFLYKLVHPNEKYLSLAFTWYVGDLFGILIVTPLIVSWSKKFKDIKVSKVLEFLSIIVVIILLSEFLRKGELLTYLNQYRLEVFILPFMLWALFRFDERGISTVIAILCGVSLWDFSTKFNELTFNQELSLIRNFQLFIGIWAISMYLLLSIRYREKEAQRKLLESEALYQATVESMPINIFNKDLNGKVTYVNSHYLKHLNLDKEKIIGKTDFDLFPKELAEKYISDDAKVIESGRALFIEEEKHKTLNGDLMYVSVVKAPIKDYRGKITGTVGAFWDVTKRKKAEIALLSAKEEAEKANKAKNLFIANISHELRTPLSVILGSAEKIEDFNSNMNPEVLACLSGIKRNAKILTEIIDDILDIAKIEANKISIEEKEINLKSELIDILSNLKNLAKEKELFFNYELKDEIPNKAVTDRVRLRQIINNIVGNAIKFTEKGSIHVSVAFSGESLTILVKDTGIGINLENRENLFKPFNQLDPSLTRKHGGSGLGLALSKIYAKKLNGDIRLIESTPSKGSVFEITVKIKTNVKEEKELQAEKKVVLQKLKDKNILVVEDSLDNQKLISYFLQKSGAIVDIAINGKEAVEKTTLKPYDFILMDIQMPVMDGYTATKLIREKGILTQIYALTAHAMLEEKMKCLNEGFNGYICKPFERELLINTIDQAINSV